MTASPPIAIQGRTLRTVVDEDGGLTPSVSSAIEAAGWLPVYPPHITIVNNPDSAYVYWTIVFEATP